MKQMNLTKIVLTLLGFWSASFMAQAQITVYPDRMYADTAFAPFYHGVASGDPLPQSVWIWTRIEPESPSVTALSADWQVATDSLFNQIVASGQAATDSSVDFTIKKRVAGLSPDTYYYYRFTTAGGQTSQTGRTRTAPTGNAARLKFGVGSCSSIYSGYFNAYRHAGLRNDLNAFIHLGDYLYDFVDEDEKVRVPEPYPAKPENLKEWRERHKYYLTDPDLRLARQRHPWIVIWDNHDLDKATPEKMAQAQQAFHEYVPMELMYPDQPDWIFRSFNFGSLVDVIMMDVRTMKDPLSVPDSVRSMMGEQQLDLLLDRMKNSTAKWRLVGSENMMGGWYAKGLPDFIPHQGDVFDLGSWDGYPVERKKIFDYWTANNINNNIILSGDAHLSVAQDLTHDPFDKAVYDSTTGQGSVGVEFLATSFTRGNLDERMSGDVALAKVVAKMCQDVNPQYQYFEATDHGYGVVEVTPDSAKAHFIYFDKFSVNPQPTGGKTMTVLNGDNHWRRDPKVTARPANLGQAFLGLPTPNPARSAVSFSLNAPVAERFAVKIVSLNGQTLGEWNIDYRTPTENLTFQLPVENLPPAVYFVYMQGANGQTVARFVKE